MSSEFSICRYELFFVPLSCIDSVLASFGAFEVFYSARQSEPLETPLLLRRRARFVSSIDNRCVVSRGDPNSFRRRGGESFLERV